MSDLDDLEAIADANRARPNTDNPRVFNGRRRSAASLKRILLLNKKNRNKRAKFHPGRRKNPITLAPIGGSK